MVTVDEAIIAKIDRNGKHFEILVDPDLAYDLREGKSISIQKMLAINIVCTDAKKGDRASPSEVEKAFGTNDMEKIAEQIVKHGEIQLTTEFRRRKIEEKRKQVANIISHNAINPQTRMPHPPDRILNAMEQVRVNIDPFKPAEQQAEEVIKAIKQILPISVEQITLHIEIPAQYSGRAYGVVKEYGIEKENWLSDGTLVVRIKIAAGIKETVYRRLAALTEGNVKVEESKGE
ncbi:MAG: ribosome assembly factor SBDS [Candidatus Aenigmarchaeota archaeon]|nr:ribosome assembly factor SBDS [Candidatus Aenigmarchaeota archaeon]